MCGMTDNCLFILLFALLRASVEGIQGDRAAAADPEAACASTLPDAHICTRPCHRQVSVLVLRQYAEKDEEDGW